VGARAGGDPFAHAAADAHAPYLHADAEPRAEGAERKKIVQTKVKAPKVTCVGTRFKRAGVWGGGVRGRGPDRARWLRALLTGRCGAGCVGQGMAKYNQQIQKWKQKQEELMPEDDDGPMTLEQLEEEKTRKAQEWFESQMASADASNPNLMPLNRAAASSHGFAVPAPPKSKQAGWRDRLAGKT
jgi:hypothetical protein